MPITLPLLEALAHLHAHNLTIDLLWTEQPAAGPPQTHVSTKPTHKRRPRRRRSVLSSYPKPINGLE
jgi:hypothetical protein